MKPWAAEKIHTKATAMKTPARHAKVYEIYAQQL